MKFNSPITLLPIIMGAALFFACEDTVTVNLENASPVLNIDAWINNKPQTQTIELTLSQSYFDSSRPKGVKGASVLVTDEKGNVFPFAESTKQDGIYEWFPSSGSFGELGATYTLTVNYNGEKFVSSCKMARTTRIDSITFKVEKGQGPGAADVEKASFWARDQIGSGDCYWIRTYKNGSLINLPRDINRAYDAGIAPTGNFDGLTFLQPIREAISPQQDEDSNGKILSPYKNGDSVYVEIHSISRLAFDYLGELRIQTNRPGGIAELFSTPLANVSTNINNENPKGSQVVGFFNVAAVSGLGRRYKK